MGNYKLVRFESGEALAAQAARDWLGELEQAEAPQYCVALCGGRIAGKFFTSFAQLPDTPELAGKVQFFWGDERCVTPSDPESNFHLAGQCLLSPLGIPVSHIHRIRGELSPAAAAAEAETEMLRHAAVGSGGRPVLDLVFLGMGEDGHVASLFPGEPQEVIRSPQIYRAVVGLKPPRNRVTLGYGSIAAARQVWVLASGAGKEGALKNSLEPDGKTPLGKVLAMREMTRLYTDIPWGW